jgi:hypothetical protein
MNKRAAEINLHKKAKKGGRELVKYAAPKTVPPEAAALSRQISVWFRGPHKVKSSEI